MKENFPPSTAHSPVCMRTYVTRGLELLLPVLLSLIWGYFLILLLQVRVRLLLHLHACVGSVDDEHARILLSLLVCY